MTDFSQFSPDELMCILETAFDDNDFDMVARIMNFLDMIEQGYNTVKPVYPKRRKGVWRGIAVPALSAIIEINE